MLSAVIVLPRRRTSAGMARRCAIVLLISAFMGSVFASLSGISEETIAKVEELAKARLLREPTIEEPPVTSPSDNPFPNPVKSFGSGLENDESIVQELRPCPGAYCGRISFLADDGESLKWSECGACPRGYRADDHSVCVECDSQPSFYDWMYLLFTVVLAITGHWITIDVCAEPMGTNPSLTTNAVVLHVASFCEVTAAALTLLVHEPYGSLRLKSCPVGGLPDWYTVFFNPRINFSRTIYCTQEAVYPLYTMVFVFYAFALIIMLTVRPIVLKVRNVPVFLGRNSIYIAMYILPVLTFSHAAIGGLLYYSFPYILIVIALIANAIHFGFKLDQSLKSLVVDSVRHVRNVVILACQWTLLAFGIVSLTQMTQPTLHYPLLALIPVPALFYIVTAQFTDPNKLFLD